MRKFVLSLGFLLLNSVVFADVATKNVVIQESDGSPTGTLKKLQVTNGTLTNSGGGTFVLDTSSGTISWVGNCPGPNCFNGSSGTEIIGYGNSLYLSGSSGYTEKLTLDFGGTEDTVAISSSTGVNNISFGSIDLTTTGDVSANDGTLSGDLSVTGAATVTGTVSAEDYIATGATSRITVTDGLGLDTDSDDADEFFFNDDGTMIDVNNKTGYPVIAMGNTQTSGNILIADGSNWVAQAMSGDATIAYPGAVAVVDDSHNHVTTNIDAATSATWLTQVTDEIPGTYFVTSMGNTTTAGNILIADGSRFTSRAMSGDVTIAYPGTVTIGSSKVTGDMLNIANSPVDELCVTYEDSASGKLELQSCGAGGGAPTTVDYLTGTASADLSAEIVVGASPGGELGGTWASPTLDDSVTVTGWTLGSATATEINNMAITSPGIATGSTLSIGNGSRVTLRSSTLPNSVLDLPTYGLVTAIGNTTDGSGECAAGAICTGGHTHSDLFYQVFNPQQAKLNSPAAAIDAANNQWRGLFDASVEECMTWETMLYPYTANLKLTFMFSMVSAVANNINTFAQVGCVTPGDAEDVDSISYGSSVVMLATVPSKSAGYIAYGGTAQAVDDSCAAGDFLTLKFCRNAPNTVDTATGDMELRKVLLYE